MRKVAWVAVTALALLLGAAWRGPGGAVIGLLIVGIPYAVVCRLSPRNRHTGFGGCKGTGEARSKLFPWAYHRCQGCNGTGRQVRLGARYIGPDYVKTEYQTTKALRQQRRQDHVHR